MLCARPISKPWCACLGPAVKKSGEGSSPNYPASVIVTGATFGSTRVTDRPHSAATAASVGTLQPHDAAFVHGSKTRGGILY